MSADLLRRAVSQMRSEKEREENLGHIDGRDYATWMKVADWLWGVSVDVDKRDNPKRVGGRYEALRIPDEHAALAVARTYLGGAA